MHLFPKSENISVAPRSCRGSGSSCEWIVSFTACICFRLWFRPSPMLPMLSWIRRLNPCLSAAAAIASRNSCAFLHNCKTMASAVRSPLINTYWFPLTALRCARLGINLGATRGRFGRIPRGASISDWSCSQQEPYLLSPSWTVRGLTPLSREIGSLEPQRLYLTAIGTWRSASGARFLFQTLCMRCPALSSEDPRQGASWRVFLFMVRVLLLV